MILVILPVCMSQLMVCLASKLVTPVTYDLGSYTYKVPIHKHRYLDLILTMAWIFAIKRFHHCTIAILVCISVFDINNLSLIKHPY